MKKLTKSKLNALEKVMPVINKTEQGLFIGGGYGTFGDPYTESEYVTFLASGYFPGGYVIFDGSATPVNMSETNGISGVDVISYDPSSLLSTGVPEWDTMYRGGFDIGFKAGLSGGYIDDIGVITGIIITGVVNVDEPGGWSVFYYNKGLRDGYAKGLALKP